MLNVSNAIFRVPGLGLETSRHHKNILDDLIENTRDAILFENKIEIHQTHSFLFRFILSKQNLFYLFLQKTHTKKNIPYINYTKIGN